MTLVQTFRDARRYWLFGNARQLVNLLRDELAPLGWCVGMTGSVLFAGVSTHDLDLVLYPLRPNHATLESVRIKLEQLGLRQDHTVEEVRAWWRKNGSKDTKHVEIWTYKKRRVDFFVLS